MSDRSRTPPTQSRRARREAERRAARLAPARFASRSPIVWITAAALVTGVVLIAVLLFTNRRSSDLSLTPPGEVTRTELADGRALGSADAPATLHVWADFQCPGCGLFARASEARVIRDYVAAGQLRLVYHDFAFLGDESRQAAIAARAAGRQGAFWQYHDWLFANQDGENRGGFRPAVLSAIADQLGLDGARFEADIVDPELANAVADETAEGRSVPVSATPTLVLGDEVITGVPAWEELAVKIEAAIASAAPSAP